MLTPAMLTPPTVLGQDAAMHRLFTGLRHGRPHHAYLFHGPEGVGKFTAALLFARCLLCHQPPPTHDAPCSPCGSCDSCRLLRNAQAQDPAAPAHPDLHVVVKELALYSDDPDVRKRKLITIPKDVLRTALLEPAHRAAQLGHGKVFIVDEAQRLGEDAQNLLLKTLEEPPAGTHILLVTSQPQRLLATIRSRSEPVAFRPLPRDLVLERARAADAEQAHWLTAFADGSFGMVDTAAAFHLPAWSQRLEPMIDRAARGQLPAELGACAAEMVEAVAEALVKQAKQASKEAANKRGVELLLRLISHHAHQRLLHAAAHHEDTQPWLRILDATQHTSELIDANVNLALACDHLALSMARADLTLTA